VTTMPPGSGPGMTHLARIPAISPTTIQTTMVPMLIALHLSVYPIPDDTRMEI
jgi:hypothetical protein